MNLGDRIAEARGPRPRSAVARACDVDVKTVYRWERAGVNPRADILATLADFCGVRLRWLLTGEGPKSSPEQDESGASEAVA